MEIRQTTVADMASILRVERDAFGYIKEADLVRDLLDDPTAKPLISLLAFDGDQAVGHILFTRAQLQAGEGSASLSLLAPLAVLPSYQNQGVGGQLIRHGLELLTAAGVDLVFVLGHPGYYPRYGFTPAGVHGFTAPYPIPPEHAGAWMVQELRPGVLGTIRGRVQCAKALDQPQHWRE